VAHSVNSRRIDPVNTQFQCAMDRCDGCFVILITPAKFPARSADGPGAKANRVIDKSELPSRFVFMSILLSNFAFVHALEFFVEQAVVSS